MRMKKRWQKQIMNTRVKKSVKLKQVQTAKNQTIQLNDGAEEQKTAPFISFEPSSDPSICICYFEENT